MNLFLGLDLTLLIRPKSILIVILANIFIISLLKTVIIKIVLKLGDENYDVEDGIVDYKNNNISIFTITILNIAYIDKTKQ